MFVLNVFEHVALNSLLRFDLFFCTMNPPSEFHHRQIPMMFHTYLLFPIIFKSNCIGKRRSALMCSHRCDDFTFQIDQLVPEYNHGKR